MVLSASTTILVTGGSGFIGSNFVLDWLRLTPERGDILNLDKLTYAANPATLQSLEGRPQYRFVAGDIGDSALVARLLADHRPRAIVHLAAESHVDRSILGPEAFLQTNISGTYTLLQAALGYFKQLDDEGQQRFRFLHVSTDEVFGSLAPGAPAFDEETAYAPRSPYAASKAASDHLVRAWGHTYGLPVLVTNCSNNYGPRQFPEKLIPLIITYALRGKRLPIYGDDRQIRDWLYVGDHTAALRTVLERGLPGETYAIGGDNERSNLELVLAVCDLLDEMVPDSAYRPHRALLTYVQDRPGHDRRYAIDAGKIERELGWRPVETVETGLRKTVAWYLENPEWVAQVMDAGYAAWEQSNYGGRERSTQSADGTGVTR